MIKRSFDILVSFIGLLILSPIFLVFAFLIPMTSFGFVFYRQKRVGLQGKNFRIYKFRTMRMAKPGEDSPPVTLKKDPRITPVGQFLRLTKLDELPQLINVLIGDMSIVGPRPEIPELVAHYTQEQMKLLSVKPGITSPATIYHRDEEEIVSDAHDIFEYHRRVLVPRKASFDLAYVERQSFLYDIKLILLTGVSVLTNQSGYWRERALKSRRMLILFAHVLISILTYYIAYHARFDWNLKHIESIRFYRTLPMAVLAKLLAISLFGLYRGYWRYVGLADVFSVFKACVFAAVLMAGADYFFLDPAYPGGVTVIDALLAFILFSALRFSTRFLREAYWPIVPQGREKILILGATDRSESLIRDIQKNPDLGYELKGFIDLDLQKRGILIRGLKVLGSIDSLDALLRQMQITTIINTYSSLPRKEAMELSKVAIKHGVRIKTLPPLSDILDGKTSSHKLRDMKFEDLLGREEVKLDIESLEAAYKGKTILITGAGGSIGSELVRQVAKYHPRQLLLLDKDETLLYEIATDLAELPQSVPVHSLIGDVRNAVKLGYFFEKYRPEIILHCAAYKHVPLLEEHPQEAFHNNVMGTRNLLELCIKSNVSRFVMISTDKAVKPKSVMGATKAAAEKLMLEMAPENGKYMAVRFGNVLGSRGSVIPLFRRQIERGGPIRITHPDITRYFMTIPEASQLVLQAGAIGNGGELFLLKMGEPVKIKDLAYRMIEFSGLIPEVDIPIEYMGLRPGEKMVEELMTESENTRSTQHEKILVLHSKGSSQVSIKSQLDEFSKGLYNKSNEEVRDFLKQIVPEYDSMANV